VLNRLLAPRPLYAVSHWLAGTVLPDVLGVAAAQVYDHRLGRALDRLYHPLPHLRALLSFLARPELAGRPWRPILVSDCKMITSEAVLACHQH